MALRWVDSGNARPMYCSSTRSTARSCTWSTMRRRYLALGMTAVLVLTLAGAPGLADAGSPQTDIEPVRYLDPRRPVADRVNDLLKRMSLDDKLGQMTQPERRDIGPDEVTRFRIGSVLSGGGSAPRPNNARNWANMYDSFQKAALAAPLRVPMLYGVDAIHGHNNVVGATIFPHNIGLGAAHDPVLVRRIGAATA